MYSIKANAHKANEQSVIRYYKQSDMFKNTVTSKLNREVMRGKNRSREEVEESILNSAAVKAYLKKQIEEAYSNWLTSNYNSITDRYNKRSELLKNKKASLEDFD